MAILIAGGAGYIGTHTCVELLQAGYDIVVVDNFVNSQPEALERVRDIAGKDFPVYELDLLSEKALSDVFSRHQIEAVIHFAGLKAVGESVAQPLRYYRTNITSTLILCETMQKYRVRRLVFSSSATVYGTTDRMPVAESAQLGAMNPYGRTKQMIEEMLQDVAAADPEWSIAILRYFNPVGAHKSGRMGENPNGIPNNLLPYISQVAVGRLEQVGVFGNDYPTKDGTGVRDYIHVSDLANGHVRALAHIMTVKGSNVYNLGTGRGYSVLEMIAAFEQASGQTIPYAIMDRRPGDIAVSYADASKANNELGWHATRGLEEMCEDAWRWQRSNPEGYKK
ncbi:UDP-glucose 4-epimerase GalE [Cohnella soli]|uniref:UDP-glucose 4-epimerase n=1 Tax=Cohnella soli TaxID=425005 RepID=A0ABW0I2I7_9BACL